MCVVSNRTGHQTATPGRRAFIFFFSSEKWLETTKNTYVSTSLWPSEIETPGSDDFGRMAEEHRIASCHRGRKMGRQGCSQDFSVTYASLMIPMIGMSPSPNRPKVHSLHEEWITSVAPASVEECGKRSVSLDKRSVRPLQAVVKEKESQTAGHWTEWLFYWLWVTLAMTLVLTSVGNGRQCPLWLHSPGICSLFRVEKKSFEYTISTKASLRRHNHIITLDEVKLWCSYAKTWFWVCLYHPSYTPPTLPLQYCSITPLNIIFFAWNKAMRWPWQHIVPTMSMTLFMMLAPNRIVNTRINITPITPLTPSPHHAQRHLQSFLSKHKQKENIMTDRKNLRPPL